jgi:hypothetical protein
VEEETGKSLHEHVDALNVAAPRAAEYADLPGLVLDVVALRQDRVPSQAGYRGIDYTRMLNEWDTLVRGIKGMVAFLEDESIFDGQRLPSYTAIPIIAALWEHFPSQPDQLGNARHLLPLPTKELLLQAEWPKGKTILGRGILGLQLRCGAEDLADGARATLGSITSKDHPREYHHLFPDSTLEDADIPDEQIYRALNCALITWRTNRTISNKDPITYLKERADNSTLGEEEIRRRLRTHLIPYEHLAVGYDGLSDEERRVRVKAEYGAFLAARAEILTRAARLACDGKALELGAIFDEGS